MAEQSGTRRAAQTYAVLGFAFVIPITASFLMFFGVWQPASTPTSLRLLAKISYELLSLLLLWVVLRRRNAGLGSIGFSFTPTAADIGHSVLLFIGSYFATTVVYAIVASLCIAINGHPPAVWRGGAMILGNGGALAIAFLFVNAFYEEILVRAFVITELEHQFASTKVAVLVSVALQASYHTYQGIPNALAVSGAFAVFSVYFVAKRRILPVVLAHLYMDVLAFLYYAHKVGG
jgi:Type II CAAX prenyl endopeptidase Rce1-like